MLSKNLEENLPEQPVNDQNVLYQAEKLSYDLENEYNGDSDDCLDLTLAETKKNIIIKEKVRISKPVVCRSSRLKKINIIMKGTFWNSDKFGDIAKHRFVKDTIREHNLDFFAILETGRSNFSQPFLNNLAGGLDYQWYCLPPMGRSGGIIVGLNAATLSVQDITIGDRCAKFYVTSKNDNFKWALVAVYGDAQDAHKSDFLVEMVRICENETFPLLVGGDFNIIRRKEEKNNDNYNPRWPFIFNAIIESLDLRELDLSGRQFTCANRRMNQTLKNLTVFW
jgi:hypothetical protein